VCVQTAGAVESQAAGEGGRREEGGNPA